MAQEKTKRLRLFTNANFSFLHFCLLIVVSVLLIGVDNRYNLNTKIQEKIFFLKQPLYTLINFPNTLFEEMKFFYLGKTTLLNENQILKEKLSKLQLYADQLETSKIENMQLKKTLKIQDLKKYETVTAQIKLPSRIDNKNKLFINKGSTAGINLGNAVINNDGLIGQVIFLTENIAEVQTINSPNFVVGGNLINGKENFFIFGNGSPFLEVPLYPIHRVINIGDIFITAGADKVYPKGIKIGEVIDIIEERRGQFFKVIIQPFAHPNTYSFVSVIKERS